MKRLLVFLCFLALYSEIKANCIDSACVVAGKYKYIQIKAYHAQCWPVMFDVLKPDDTQIFVDTTSIDDFIKTLFESAYYVPELMVSYDKIYQSVYGELDFLKINTFIAEFVGKTKDYSQETTIRLGDGWTVTISYLTLTGFFYFTADKADKYLNSDNDTYLKEMDNLKCVIPICIQFYDNEKNRDGSQ